MPTLLPVDSLMPEILASLRAHSTLVLEAPPGAGKTTRVPPALLAAGFGEVVVLEPRRIAARLAARRVAEELGEGLGRTVGYHVRFDSVDGPETRLRFVTEGVLTRRLLSDPLLKGVGAVVLDEFHERHLEGDLALALLRRLQERRPELRLVVMSATLRGAQVSEALGGCPLLRSEGRLFPLEVEYTPESAQPLEERVAAAVSRLLEAETQGDVLVFLPGAFEIRRAQRACESLKARHGAEVLPLHGDSSPEEQDRAVLPGPVRKVILSTNVAESSITIEGVRAVVDSGLARVAADSKWTGLPRVEVARISRASAAQRAGRAGRTGPGRVVRLYTEADFLRRAEAETPEILRRELAQLCLDLHAAGWERADQLEWLDAPPADHLELAEGLLRRLGAISQDGNLTGRGRRMARLPLHPRLAALCVVADERGAGETGCAAAALLASGARLPEIAPHAADSDLDVLLERQPEQRVRQLERQLVRVLRPAPARGAAGEREQALRLACLEAFPDRVVARRRGREWRMAGGTAVQQAPNSAVEKAQLAVTLDVEERPDQGLPAARLLCAIEPEWLLDLFPERVGESSECEWNREAERVERRSALLYDGLVIEESRSEAAGEDVSTLLAEKAAGAGVHRFADAEKVEELGRRLRFAAEQGLGAAIPEDLAKAALRRLAGGLRSFAELERAARDGGLEQAMLDCAGTTAAQLDRVAPERIRLPGGRNARVFYREGQPPWVTSRLQDFFGMKETPRVAGGRVALVVHLLAPNQRPVQMTQDLAGFWERLYPQVRKELMRRYPRHAWPENPYLPETAERKR